MCSAGNSACREMKTIYRQTCYGVTWYWYCGGWGLGASQTSTAVPALEGGLMTRPDRSCPAPHKAKEASCNFGCCLFTVSQWNCISRLKMQIIAGTCFLFFFGETVAQSMQQRLWLTRWKHKHFAFGSSRWRLLDVQSPHQALGPGRLEAAFRSAHRTRYRTAARGHMC